MDPAVMLDLFTSGVLHCADFSSHVNFLRCIWAQHCCPASMLQLQQSVRHIHRSSPFHRKFCKPMCIPCDSAGAAFALMISMPKHIRSARSSHVHSNVQSHCSIICHRIPTVMQKGHHIVKPKFRK